MSKGSDDIDPGYAAACSDVTLYSNPKGFFRCLAEELLGLASKGDWLEQVFGTQCDDAAKLAAVMENKQLSEVLREILSRVQPLHRGKDGKVSQEKMLAAQAAIENGDFMLALGLSSQAVLKAPLPNDTDSIDGGVSLAMSLWLRSEVLMKMNKFELALDDLKMALKERLPAKMRPQYYWRMGHCYKGAGEPIRAKVSYELADRLLGNNDAARKVLAEDMSRLDYTQVDPKPPSCKEEITVAGGAKPNVPALSKLVNITEEENKGRFAVANSAIKTGDVVLMESPYAACLLPDFFGTHCLHCFKRLEAPVWCPKCSGVAFCGQQCRDLAVTTYHAFECSFVDLLIGSGMSILSHIALRMVTQAGLDTSVAIHSKYLASGVKTVEGLVLTDIEGMAKKNKVKSRRERMNRNRRGSRGQLVLNKNSGKDEPEPSEGEAKVEDKVNYEENLEAKAAQIYSLCSHSDARKPGDYFKRIIMSMFLKECLKKANFFEKCNEENLVKYETYITELLLRNLQLLQFNAHEVYETIRTAHKFSGSKASYLGVGIYPTGALFNHECYPSVTRYFTGRNIVLRATRPMYSGDVVAENYGPHFLMRNRKERQLALASRYWFQCRCIACIEDWPTLKMLNSDTPPLIRCTNEACKYKFSGNIQNLPNTCPKCSKAIQKDALRDNLDVANECVMQYQKGAILMDKEKTAEAIETMANAIDIFHGVASPPHKDTHVAQEALRSCYADSGNIHIVETIEDVTKDA